MMTEKRILRFVVWYTQLAKVITAVFAIITLILVVRSHYLIKEADKVLNNVSIGERIPIEIQIRNTNDRIAAAIKYLMVNTKVIETEEAVQPEMTTEKSEKCFSEDDVYLLAQLMYAEEGIFFKEYKENPEKVEKVHKLCGSVVLHRAEVNYLNCNSIKEVIYCKGQYASQTIKRVSEGQDIPDVVYTWAEELLKDGGIGPKGLIYQAEFNQGTIYEEIGNQKFCIEDKYN